MALVADKSAVPGHTLAGSAARKANVHTLRLFFDRFQRDREGFLQLWGEKNGEADLIRDLAFVLPAKIMSRVLGLPQEDFEIFRAWAMDIITVAGDPSTAFASAEALRAYLDPIIASRRADPGADVISRLVTAQIDGDELSHSQIQSFLLTLLPAGIETTYRSLGSLLLILLSGSRAWDRLVADATLIRPAIEEILRFEAPLQVVFRTSRMDQELMGTPIRAGYVCHSGHRLCQPRRVRTCRSGQIRHRARRAEIFHFRLWEARLPGAAFGQSGAHGRS